jgi:AcrR family transcriptional regulator
MSESSRAERRAREKRATRSSILDAARTVAARDGARSLSLRAVAAEAGFAPAALYGYFRNKDELLLALAGDDLGELARAMRSAARNAGGSGALAAAASLALSSLQTTETIAAASFARHPVADSSEAERQFNGRVISVLTALSDATGRNATSRESQCDVVVLAAALAGLAMMGRSGRLDSLGFTTEELLLRLEARFAGSGAA